MNTLLLPTNLVPIRIVKKKEGWIIVGLPNKSPFIHEKGVDLPKLIFGCKKYDVCFMNWNILALYQDIPGMDYFPFKYKMVLGRSESSPRYICRNQLESLIETVFNPGLECLNKHFHLLNTINGCNNHQ